MKNDRPTEEELDEVFDMVFIALLDAALHGKGEPFMQRVREIVVAE